MVITIILYVCMSTEIGRKCTNGGAAAAVVLAPLSGHTCCWIVLPVCSRVRALHGPSWVCATDKTLFVSYLINFCFPLIKHLISYNHKFYLLSRASTIHDISNYL
jgi:hypothetical protein